MSRRPSDAREHGLLPTTRAGMATEGSRRPVACVNLPELPLQLLLRRHPRWRGRPVALVAEERPEEPLLVINAAARRACLRPGMRFGIAKSLAPDLCAGAVSEVEIERACCELVADLQTFSPHVERDPQWAGVFYLDPTGLAALYGDARTWARSVLRFVRGRGYVGSLVVGHGRTLSYCAAQLERDVRVFDAGETLKRAHRVPLVRLGMGPRLRDGLERLGLACLGDLARFGADELRLRFGAEAGFWARVARGDEVRPLRAELHAESVTSEVAIEPPDDDIARLCFALKGGLQALYEQLLARGEGAAALHLILKLERGGRHEEHLSPSRTTRDPALWLELIRLRLGSVALEDRVQSAELLAEGVRVAPGQVALFPTGRDLAAGDRALSRLRAMFGEQSVRRAVLREGHLPEAKFRWQAVEALTLPRSRGPEDSSEEPGPLPLVRRLLRRPERLDAQLEPSGLATEHRPFSARLRERGEPAPLSLTGPYRLSGGWWVREVTRDYYYAESASGALRWLFYDHVRKGWFFHAQVE